MIVADHPIRGELIWFVRDQRARLNDQERRPAAGVQKSAEVP